MATLEHYENQYIWDVRVTLAMWHAVRGNARAFAFLRSEGVIV